jgi:hypothetical protein
VEFLRHFRLSFCYRFLVPIMPPTDPESLRLAADTDRIHNWKRWGPYLAERQWGTVREDYSEDGNCWDFFPHEHARSRAYRWGEDGLLGLTDRQCRICLAPALWNGQDPYLKERLFGLTNPQGNHSEDVKEEYYYLRSTPTHSYMRGLYKYPQRRFPYADLIKTNASQGRLKPEYELADTGVFDDRAYWDVQVEYAKADAEDLLICYTITNRGRDAAQLHLLPQIWFRNVWSWSGKHLSQSDNGPRPALGQISSHAIWLERETLGRYEYHLDAADTRLKGLLFTENNTNYSIFGTANVRPQTKDAFHRHVVGADSSGLHTTPQGTKAAAHYLLHVEGGQSTRVRIRFRKCAPEPMGHPFADFDKILAQRNEECDAFYTSVLPKELQPEDREVCVQAYSGLMWSKQFYYYPVDRWLPGDPNRRFNPEIVGRRRNKDWKHLFARDVISMPDKWEYPWFAAWDLAFHTVPLARMDPGFAKKQLTLLLQEWYMHPNGQIPAYEFAFGDVNPPVHAWAALRVYRLDAALTGKKDRSFLVGMFQKLLVNFTWWVNRKDSQGDGIFSGGFLGLDNIGIFDRGAPLPTGGELQQADATAWMAFYCTQMLRMALELAFDGEQMHPAYQDMASKFMTHFVQIVDAVNTHGGTGLWDEMDGFYYDHIRHGENGAPIALKSRSLVGLLPIIAVKVLDDELLANLPKFMERLNWFRTNWKALGKHVVEGISPTGKRMWLFSLASRERLAKVLRHMLDESEFLSQRGIRSLSRYHLEKPFTMDVHGQRYEVRYTPGDSTTDMFGGNSNWRGPIWFPINYLLIESLERYHEFYGDSFTMEYPTGSGTCLNLRQIAWELKRRHASIFQVQADGHRPCHNRDERYKSDPAWKELVLFYEFFNGETGAGHGASHQTGWTALAAMHLEDIATGL